MVTLSTQEVMDLTEDLRTYEMEPEKREEYLPTKDQTRRLIAFLASSEECESVKGITEERGIIIPKRATCVRSVYNKYEREAQDWIDEHPEKFQFIYRSIWWR